MTVYNRHRALDLVDLVSSVPENHWKALWKRTGYCVPDVTDMLEAAVREIDRLTKAPPELTAEQAEILERTFGGMKDKMAETISAQASEIERLRSQLNNEICHRLKLVGAYQRYKSAVTQGAAKALEEMGAAEISWRVDSTSPTGRLAIATHEGFEPLRNLLEQMLQAYETLDVKNK